MKLRNARAELHEFKNPKDDFFLSRYGLQRRPKDAPPARPENVTMINTAAYNMGYFREPMLGLRELGGASGSKRPRTDGGGGGV